MPSSVVGELAVRNVALNCGPCVGLLTQAPLACTNCPALMAPPCATTVIGSRWPRTFTRRTQKPFSGL